MRFSRVGCITNSAAPASRANGSSVARPSSRHASTPCNAPQAKSHRPQYCDTSTAGWIALKKKANSGMASA